MSRRSIKEYILRKRDDYLGETQSGKHKMLDEICKTVGLTRKYVIKLLSGNIEYRERAAAEDERPDDVSCAVRRGSGQTRVVEGQQAVRQEQWQ